MSEVANTEKLIELVRERSLLYDLSDVDYKNRDKKAEAWLQVATEMGFGETKLWMNKWKSLRDNYNKFKKNKESPSGQAYKKYKAWPWASHMRFLDDFNVQRPTESNSQPFEFQTINHTNFPTDIDTDNFSVDETQNTTYYEVPEYEAGPSKQIRKKRIRTSTDSSDCNKIIESKMDGVDLLFLSYAQTFKTFSPRMQSMLKLEMATLFARYELKEEGKDASAPQSSNQMSCSSARASKLLSDQLS